MNKRPYSDDRDRGQAHHKKHKHDDRSHHKHRDGGSRDSNSYNQNPSRPEPKKQSIPYDEALAKLPPPTSTLPPVATYTHFTVSTHLPTLPEITNPHLAAAPFRHKSTSTTYNRSTSTSSSSSSTTDVTYEKLEFLGDAQLEHIASRLLYTRFPHLTAGQQSQLRELLVKNETLAEYARAYGFDQRVQVEDQERMVADAKAGNKGFNKVLGDVFEAYIAAVVLSHGDEGFAVAEKWMTGLWAPKIVEAAGRERYWTPGLELTHEAGKVDPLKTYNPAAKAELQRLVLSGKDVKLDYEPYQKSVELKGDQLGQNRHFVAVYLTGYGYTKKMLGKGEGKNKVEAGNWAAQEAMFGESKELVGECAKQLAAVREVKKREREEAEAREKAGAAEGEVKKE